MTESQEQFIKKCFDRIGLSVRRARHARPLDLTALEWRHPIELFYQAEARPLLVKVPVEKIITFGLSAFPMGEGSPNPFYQTLRVIDRPEGQRYRGSPLEKFYQNYQPKTAAERLGIPADQASVLHKLPPSAAPLPWHNIDPQEMIRLRRRQVEEDNRAHGSRLPAEAGDPFYGPVSEEKGGLEFRRLQKIYQAIRDKGFIVDPRGFDNITAIVLTKGEQWRFMIAGSGQHRIAAMAAQGHSEVIVQLQTSGYAGGRVGLEDMKYLAHSANVHWSF